MSVSDLLQFLDIHKGSKCFVLGAGPSVGFLKIGPIFNYPVFSVNSSVLLCPWNEPGDDLKRFWVSTDMLCMQWSYFYEKVVRGDCTRVVRNSWKRNTKKIEKEAPFVYYSPRRSLEMPKKREEGLFGGSSILSALDLAILTGCKDIILLGVDHRMLHGKSHFWQYWPVKKRPVRAGKSGNFSPCQRQQSRVFMSNNGQFKILKKLAKKHGSIIYNCSSISTIEAFPKISFDDALAL